MGDPLSMLGPALAGLGSIPGQLGGAASSLPMDALGSLAPLAGELAGQGSGDGDSMITASPRILSMTRTASPMAMAGKPMMAAPAKTTLATRNQTRLHQARLRRPQQSAPAAAVPASVGGDPGRVVQMPDGSPVTAPSAQHATAMRAVLNGATVTDAWKQANVQLAPPGTPVTAPADPAPWCPAKWLNSRVATR